MLREDLQPLGFDRERDALQEALAIFAPSDHRALDQLADLRPAVRDVELVVPVRLRARLERHERSISAAFLRHQRSAAIHQAIDGVADALIVELHHRRALHAREQAAAQAMVDLLRELDVPLVFEPAQQPGARECVDGSSAGSRIAEQTQPGALHDDTGSMTMLRGVRPIAVSRVTVAWVAATMRACRKRLHSTPSAVCMFLSLLMLGFGGCATAQIRFYQDDLEKPAVIRLDQLWEAYLLTYPGPTAPYAPEEAVARCIPDNRCRTAIFPEDKLNEARLDVIGLEPGPAKVELRYRQPGSTDWLTHEFSFEFVAPTRYPELVLGGRVPHGRLELPDISPVIACAAEIEGPARCEPQTGAMDWYVCFGRERFGDQVRYASCATTDRCKSKKYGVLQRGFWLGLDGDDGRAVRMDFMVHHFALGLIEDSLPRRPKEDDDE